MSRAVVYKEKALGLLRGDRLNVLSANDETLLAVDALQVFEEEIRDATRNDFENFGVRYQNSYFLEVTG